MGGSPYALKTWQSGRERLEQALDLQNRRREQLEQKSLHSQQRHDAAGRRLKVNFLMGAGLGVKRIRADLCRGKDALSTRSAAAHPSPQRLSAPLPNNVTATCGGMTKPFKLGFARAKELPLQNRPMADR
jgi:hypothetical protein